MRGAHGHRVGGHGQRGAQGSDRDLKGGVALGVGGQVLLAVHDHIVIVGAAPCDGGGHLAVGHGQSGGAVHGGTAGAALQCHRYGVFAVCGGLGGLLGRGLGIAHAHGVVVPGTLGTQNGQREVLIQCGDRDVIAVHLFTGAVGVGHSVGGGQQPVRFVGLGISGQAGVQVHDLFGHQADMEGHLAVLDGQGAFAVAGLVGMEHAAVGIKLGSVYAVRQSGGLRDFGCGGTCRAGRGLGRDGRRSGGRSAAACQRSGQQHGDNGKGKHLFAAHRKIPQCFRIRKGETPCVFQYTTILPKIKIARKDHSLRAI